MNEERRMMWELGKQYSVLFQDGSFHIASGLGCRARRAPLSLAQASKARLNDRTFRTIASARRDAKKACSAHMPSLGYSRFCSGHQQHKCVRVHTSHSCTCAHIENCSTEVKYKGSVQRRARIKDKAVRSVGHRLLKKNQAQYEVERVCQRERENEMPRLTSDSESKIQITVLI
jgi:hypothetical protein